MLSKKIQILLDQKEYAKLKKIGEKAHKSLGQIFREAVKLYAERLASRAQRLAVVEKITKLKAPIDNWAKMEKEIISARPI